ncbi:5-bromo-4-chloroindolyl phosphate hydrolysis family protein [Aquidulcibacter sp.]|uniref:5-bromo-4-chloroindolyl phosphate hydrolysis family protein n=1 Tax=Aquidulcibacter sp. TaxID=2052990 RepID=UPI0025C322C7|nr:5-bromo-4-chloroindolyl phosphate hydrolysis family protein [Aquidulcibacter sp.]MCA3694367.1 5-bromo-4-chloroindolyl phosphate hydrolysis family protein [Aquidulcibacter sp.]
MAKPPSDTQKPRRGGAGTSWWVIFGSLAASLAIGGALLVELRSGPIVAGLVALSLYGFLTVALPKLIQRKAAPDEPSPPELDPEDSDPRHALMVEAHQHILAIRAAIPAVPLPVGQVLDALVRHGLTILDTVASQPEKLNPILRFFTYYLPATADLVSDRLKLEAHAGQARLAEIDHTLGRLQEAFASFERAVVEPDLASVDLDIELLDRALKDDLAPR